MEATLDIDEVRERLKELNELRLAAKTLGEELDAWAAWCKMWDQKEYLEQAARDSATAYAL